MKKFVSLLLALAMVFTLTACGGAASSDGGNVKIGLICLHDENSTYDLNFINGFKDACKNCGLEEGSGYIIKTNIPEGQECYEAACDLVDSGCNAVFADSFGHEPYILQAAKEFIDVYFAHATGTKAHTEKLPNFVNAFASIYQGRYLAGVVGGMKLNQMIEEGKITADQAKVGYIGAFTYAEVISGYTSFFLGVRSVCPSATMEVTFTGSWYDEIAEKEGAQMLINNGCVLISQHADSMGAPTACETAGVPNVSYNGSTINAAPNTFLVSSRINWTPFFESFINARANNAELGVDYCSDLKTGGVVLSDLNDAVVAPGTADALAKAKAAIEDGSLHVFDAATFQVEGAPLTTYLADVDDMGDYQPDTEVIIDGYFHESEFRSAPYFDLNIDGITLLDTKF